MWKEIIAGTALVSLASCEVLPVVVPVVDVNGINKDSTALDKICADNVKVPNYVPNSASVIEFQGKGSFGLCGFNEKNLMLVYSEVGGVKTDVYEPLITGTEPTGKYDAIGYNDENIKFKAISTRNKSTGDIWVVIDGKEYLSDGPLKVTIDKFIESLTYSEASAAGLPTTRPTETPFVLLSPTPPLSATATKYVYDFTPTAEASATLETPTMSPEEKAVLDLGYTINDGMAFGKDGKKIIFRERELSDKAVFEIAAKDYQATNIGKENFNNPQPSREFQNYTLAIIDEAEQTLRKRNQLSRSWYPVLIPNSNNGWIVFYEENDVILNAIYRKSNGTLVIYSVFEDVSN